MTQPRGPASRPPSLRTWSPWEAVRDSLDNIPNQGIAKMCVFVFLANLHTVGFVVGFFTVPVKK